MNLREIENYGLKILNERAKDGSMTVYAKFSEAEKRNQNSRIYPLEILSREVDRVQMKINAGQFLGQSDHSDSPATFLKDVSHVVTKLEMIGNNGYATIRILNTDAGKNVQEIIRGKGKIGISTRSVGTVSATGRVQKDLRLLALDLVANPSVKDATIGKENILEGLEFEEESLDEATYKCECIECGHKMTSDKHCDTFKCEKCGGKMRRSERPGPGKEDLETQRKKDLEESISDLEKESYLGACESGFKGTEAEWHELYGGGLREMVGLPVSGREIPIEKLTEGQISARKHTYFVEACASGFSGTYKEFCEKFPAIVEQAKEKKVVVEKKEKPKEPFKSSATWAEIQLSGFRGTPAEYQESFPNIIIIKPEPPRQPVVEKLERALTEKEILQEAARIFTALSTANPDSSLQLEDVERMLQKEEIAKSDKRLRKQAIYIVNASLAGSGASPSQEMLSQMVETEIDRLKKLRQERRDRNWAAYKKLLD